jgi:two-component system NtrC family sensor kinase
MSNATPIPPALAPAPASSALERSRPAPPPPPPISPSTLVLMTAILILLAFSTYHVSSRYAIMQALIQVLVFGYFVVLGRQYPQVWTHGWSYILIGVNLVTFGSIVEISDLVPFLHSSLTTRDEPFRTFLKQIVGNNTGFLLLAFGFYRWVPSFLASRRVMEDLVRKYEAQLIRNEKLNALAGLVTGVAHELNNPLAVVLGYASLLARNPDVDVARKAVDEIQKAAQRCKKVAGNLLSFARQPLPDRRATSIPEVIDEALQLLDYQLRLAAIRVERDFATDVPMTVADPDQLLQVFFNLINNARQAMAEHAGPRVLRVSCRAEGRTIQVRVSDTGPGIPAENLERIFQPFFTTKNPGEGTGLGLPICFGIMKVHRGNLRVESEPGVRTEFICDLPVVQAAAAVPEADPDAADADERAPARYPGRRALVVDDDEAILRYCSEYLKDLALDVDLCRSGSEAMERLESRMYDLILLDVRMPDLDGREILGRLRAAGRHQCERVVFITGDTADRATMDFLQSCGRPYLLKPFAPTAADRLLALLLRGSGGDGDPVEAAAADLESRAMLR